MTRFRSSRPGTLPIQPWDGCVHGTPKRARVGTGSGAPCLARRAAALARVRRRGGEPPDRVGGVPGRGPARAVLTGPVAADRRGRPDPALGARGRGPRRRRCRRARGRVGAAGRSSSSRSARSAIVAAGGLHGDVAAPFLAILPLPFVFVGFTQRRGTSLAHRTACRRRTRHRWPLRLHADADRRARVRAPGLGARG